MISVAKQIVRQVLNVSPLWMSCMPLIQVRIHAQLGGNIHRSARIHFSVLDASRSSNQGGGITIGPNVVVKRGVSFCTHWKICNKAGVPLMGSGGDVILQKNATIESGIVIQAGTVVPAGTKVRSQKEANALQGAIFHDDGNLKPSSNLKDVEPSFVLGTGRSGTTSLTKLPPKNGQFARHESHKWLNAIGYAKHVGCTESCVDDLLKRWNVFYSNEQKVIDSDQRFYNLIPELNLIFPSARYLHVIRSAAGFVESAKPRGLYNIPEPVEHRWSFYRPASNIMTKEEWEEMGQVDRLLWYWSMVNSEIQSELSKISPKQVCIVWLESPRFSETCIEFLNLSGIETIPKANSSAENKIQKLRLTEAENARCLEEELKFRSRWNLNLP